MDRIAREGVRFTEAFVTNSLCGPSAPPSSPVSTRTRTRRLERRQPAFRDQKGLEGGPRTSRPSAPRATPRGSREMAPEVSAHGVRSVGRLSRQGLTDPRMIANGSEREDAGNSEDVVGDQSIEFWRGRRGTAPSVSSRTSRRRTATGCRPPLREGLRRRRDAAPRTLDDSLEGGRRRPEADMAVADMPDTATGSILAPRRRAEEAEPSAHGQNYTGRSSRWTRSRPDPRGARREGLAANTLVF